MAKRNGPGIRKGGAEGRGHNVPQAVRCVNCGCHLDPGEHCDCEQQEGQRKAARKAEKARAIIAHHQRLFHHALVEWDYA